MVDIGQETGSFAVAVRDVNYVKWVECKAEVNPITNYEKKLWKDSFHGIWSHCKRGNLVLYPSSE